MNTIILHGGQYHVTEDDVKRFFDTFILKGDEVILDCIWGREDMDERFKIDQDFFSNMAPGVILLKGDFENFQDDVHKAQVIFFQGGNVNMIVEKMNHIKNIKELLSGKIIVGVSDGASALCEKYGVGKTMRIGDGVGFVRRGFLPHYRSERDEFKDIDWVKLEYELRTQKQELPIDCVREGDFIIVNQEYI